MATTVQEVKKARKAQGPCGSCRQEIKEGMPYRYWKFRHGGTQRRCMKPQCAPKRWDLTQNEVLSTLWQTIDSFDPSAYEDFGALKEALEDMASEIRDNAIALLEEKMDNIESGFGHTEVPAYQELEERKDALESFCDDLESAAGDLETDHALSEEELEDLDEEERAEKQREALEAAREAAQEAVNGCPE